MDRVANTFGKHKSTSGGIHAVMPDYYSEIHRKIKKSATLTFGCDLVHSSQAKEIASRNNTKAWTRLSGPLPSLFQALSWFSPQTAQRTSWTFLIPSSSWFAL